MTTDVTVWLSTPAGERLACLAPEWVATKGYRFARLAYRRVENGVTELVLTMPLSMAPPVCYFALDSRIEVWVDGRLDTETLWFVRVPPALRYGDDGVLYLEVRAVCALYLLAGRIVAYAAGSAQAVKSGLAGNLMHAIVRENLGSLATADRDLSAYLAVAADPGTGAQVYKTFPRRNVLLVLQEIARASAQKGVPIFFDIVWTGERLEFRTYANYRGVDHSRSSAAPIVLSPEFETLSEAGRMFDHREEITVVYCAGQGTEAQRLVVSVSDDARRLASPFNRREMFVDARYLSLTDSLATEADGALWRRRPIQRLSGTVQSTDEFAYGVHWGFGDLTAAEFNGEVLAVRVHAVNVEVAKGARTVTAELRVDSLEIDDPVRRIEGILDSQAPAELPVFSTTPLDGAVPRAPVGSTTIADGWLSAAIARVSDLTAHAALASGVHGVGSSYVAKTSRSDQWPDWADVQSKPSTFAPSAHASSHKHGGSDEVAVATPTANAIPKASSSSTLADAWLSAAIARVADITAHAAVKNGVHGLANSGGFTLTIPATGTAALRELANTFTMAQTLSPTHTVANTTANAFTFQMSSSVTTQAGFGLDLVFNLEADSGTQRTAMIDRFHWAVATDASRRGRRIFYVFDSVGARECMRLEATGSGPAVGFNGVAAVARQSLTALSMAVGTGDNSVADVGASFNQTTLNNNFRDVVDKINVIRTILVNVGIAV